MATGDMARAFIKRFSSVVEPGFVYPGAHCRMERG
jgi:hypothetical protein